MAILINEKTRLVVQGITGKEGSYHTKVMKDYGVKIVAGVSPGKGGTFVEGVPVYNTVREAVKKWEASASIIFVPALFASDAILEAIDAELDLVVCITDGIPVQDMMKIKRHLQGKTTKLLGPNCPGIISPRSRTKAGIMPTKYCQPGHVGIISRSGSLTYEVIAKLTESGLGQSTSLGIGGDPITGLSFIDCLKEFQEDPETKVVVIVGEIGGSAEEKAAEWIKASKFPKPVVAYICGLHAPKEKRMGHAGAIIADGRGLAVDKIRALEAAGVKVASNLNEISRIVKEVLKDQA